MARRRNSVRIGVTGLGEREELAPGIFINNHYRGCTPGFIYTEEGIILVDAPSDSQASYRLARAD